MHVLRVTTGRSEEWSINPTTHVRVGVGFFFGREKWDRSEGAVRDILCAMCVNIYTYQGSKV